MPLRSLTKPFALLLGATSFLLPSVTATAVNVALEASFGAPPYLLELLETAAQENASSYFPLLDRIAEGYFSDFTTEKELYDGFLRVVEEDGHFQNPEAFSTFKLALSLHTAAPRIQAHYQYYNTTIEPVLTKAQDASCPVWIHFNGKQYCSPELDRAQQDFGGPNEHDLPFDRAIRSSSDDSLVSTLYVDISNPLFGHFHQTLSETAKQGQNAYRIRYRPPFQEERKPLRVSGYGVELQLKRTDYIVIDDREDSKKSASKKPQSDKDVEDASDLKPLSSSELLGLGLKTSSYILNSEDPFDTLLKVSQDFPKYSSSLAQSEVSSDFLAEHETNREIFLSEGFNVLWMNGLQIAWREMDAYALLDRLKRERSLVHSLQAAGLSAPEAISLISNSAVTDARAEDDVVRYDWRDQIEGGKVIMWLNDIEKDSRYADWPTQAVALLQRMYPGQMPSVRRDIHNMLVPIDLSTVEGVDTVTDVLLMLVRRQIPVRFGFVPAGTSRAASEQARIVYYLRDTYGIGTVISYLQVLESSKKPEVVNEKQLNTVIKDKTPRKGREALSFNEIISGEATQQYLENAKAYLSRLGAKGPDPPGFVNGVPVAQNEQWLQVMSNRVSIDVQAVQQKVYTEGIGDDVWIAGEFIVGASTHRNPLIIPEDEDDVKLLNIGPIYKEHKAILDQYETTAADKSTNISHWSHVIGVLDLSSPEGTALADGLKSLKSGGKAPGAEITIIDNSEASVENEALISALGFKAGQNGIIVNGRRVGPITAEDRLSIDDLEELLKYEQKRRLGPVVQALSNLTLTDRVATPHTLASISALVALSAVSQIPQGIYENSGVIRVDIFTSWQDDHTSITIGNNKTATVQIVGSIDPTSELAQRWIPIIKSLSELDGVFVKLYLNPRQSIKELPIKRFYRYVLETKPHFSEDGALITPGAKFDGLPREALLNLGMDVPPAWLVSPKESIYDPDNLKLSAVPSGDVDTVYELEYILMEGHSKDTTTGNVPKGAQLILGTDSNPQTADTLIMANLGYFQFKSNPGYWNLQLKPGRSSEIYKINTIGAGEDDQANVGHENDSKTSTHVALMSWQGQTLYPRFSRNPGKETEDVLDTSGAASTGDFLAKAKSFGQNILSKTGVKAQKKNADVNIFSVASGHLYERMLNIMMVSVMKNTKHTVKFWFIEQFLSPSFKSTIPHLAKEYGFEYELVTYKWPHWLRSQKEKQREIWGYKILFLDVLFPLDLDKVIFVDSDQIVRTDMYELVTHDLQGAPYGFTPMCDSRTEMEGFRFWKQGYWKNFLQGLPYHISALFVVDLKRFRAMAAGDRLRGQYHQLSADPNSLSNLDQDLPNNMQMQLPIHSLPQEWLWCETWCSDESLKDARTIDLCNNPLTKEPKLDRARRQIPEWNVYDQEIADVFRRARSEEGVDAAFEVEGVNIQEEMDRQAKKEHDEQKRREKDEL